MDHVIINNEKCFSIAGFSKYHISESGRIYRTKPNTEASNENKVIVLRESKIHFRIRDGKLRDGYASLTDDKGKLHSLPVAKLVALTFGVIKRKLNRKKQKIDYKDGNKKNLHYSNLFVTNRIYPNSKLTSQDVKEIRKLIKKDIPLNRIGYLFNVSEMQINRIKTGENWGNGKRKIKAPKAPFEIEDGRIRKYIATFKQQKIDQNIRKKFTVRRNPKNPIDNTIVGIVEGYKLSLKHQNITRAREIVEKLNNYFFEHKTATNSNNVKPNYLFN